VGLLVALGALVTAPTALAAPLCPSSFATDINSAAAGSTVIAPAGTCGVNITVTNTNKFTIQAAPGGTTLIPATANTPIIQSSSNVAFTVSGISFTGMNGAAAMSIEAATPAVTLSGDMFTDNNGGAAGVGAVLIEANSPTEPTILQGNIFGAIGAGNTSAGGGAVYISGDIPLSVLDNHFIGNSAPGENEVGGGLTIATFEDSATAAVNVSGNTFGGTAAGAGNSSNTAGGGAFIELAPGQPLTLDNNQFIDNAVTGSGAAHSARLGGGLVVTIEDDTTTFPVTQAHNLFEGNVINATEASGETDLPAGGAGEWLFGVTDHSTDDVFTGNRVAVNDGAPPEGGGLGVQGQTEESPTPPQPGVFVGTNDLFTGNTVAAGGWGGAIYSGFIEPYCFSSCPGSTVALEDSTVVGNSVDAGSGSEGGAIWGSPGDTLTATNSVIYGNSPTPEIFGYQSAHPAFSYSDVCNESGGPAVSGQGLICANPDLNANGTETSSSPTVDAGANALVPAGVTTDLAGSPRIAASRVSCSGPGPAIVDMGAFEATFTEVPSCNAHVDIGRGQLADKHGKAKLKLSCPDGYLYCKGTVTITTVKRFATGTKGKHGKAGRAKPLKLGTLKFQIGTGGSHTLTIKLSSAALAKLAKLGSVKILIAVTDEDAHRDHGSSSHKTTLKLPKAKHKKRHK
jgi:hypothetical protein